MGKIVVGYIAGLVSGALLLVAVAFAFVSLGGVPMGTQNPPLPLERYLAHKALQASIGDEFKRESPVPADATSLVAGAKVYLNHCAGCHGLPGGSPSAFSKGMFPHAPFLMPPRKGVTDDPIGETYWKVKNGIRLTGMPAFGAILSDTEMWQVSQALLHADTLPPEALSEMKPGGK